MRPAHEGLPLHSLLRSTRLVYQELKISSGGARNRFRLNGCMLSAALYHAIAVT